MQLKWFSEQQAHGGTRHRLYKRNTKFSAFEQTPYFIDAAPNKAHYTNGCKYGLFGSGMGKLIEQADVPYRIAACFGGFTNLQPAKAKAESFITTTRANNPMQATEEHRA